MKQEDQMKMLKSIFEREKEQRARLATIIAKQHPDHASHQHTEKEPEMMWGLLVRLPIQCSCGEVLWLHREDFEVMFKDLK